MFFLVNLSKGKGKKSRLSQDGFLANPFFSQGWRWGVGALNCYPAYGPAQLLI